jgi:hypothetical protein
MEEHTILEFVVVLSAAAGLAVMSWALAIHAYCRPGSARITVGVIGKAHLLGGATILAMSLLFGLFYGIDLAWLVVSLGERRSGLAFSAGFSCSLRSLARG